MADYSTQDLYDNLNYINETLDNAVSKPSPITNASGFNTIDIDFNTD